MSICDYLYVSGLRVESGQAVVEIDGKRLRVVRNGKGASRTTLASENPPSDGEITLKDLQARLKASGTKTAEVTIVTPDGSFDATLDPARAMGRKGRTGDYAAALADMDPASREIAARYQLRTLPYGEENASVAKARLSEVLRHVDVSACTTFLPPQFGRFAPAAAVRDALRVAAPADALRFGLGQMDQELFTLAVEAAPFEALRYALDHITPAGCITLATRIIEDSPADTFAVLEMLDSKLGEKQKRTLLDVMLKNEEWTPWEKIQERTVAVFDALEKDPTSKAALAARERLLATRGKDVLEHAAGRITSEELAHLAEGSKDRARLALAHAADRLSDEQITRLAERVPADALRHAADRIPDELFYSIAESAPAAALAHAAHRLSIDEFTALLGDDDVPVALGLADLSFMSSWEANEVRKGVYRRSGSFEIGSVLPSLSEEQIGVLAERHPARMLAVADGWLSDEQLARAAERKPAAALVLAADRLSDEQLTRLAEREPAAALRHAADHLSDEQIARLAEREPAAALEHCTRRLSPAQLARLTMRDPDQLRNIFYIGGVSDDQIVALAEADPWYGTWALERTPERLSGESIAQLVERAPAAVLEHAAARLSDEQVAAIAEREPRAVLEHAAARLSDEQFARAAEREPRYALTCAPRRISDEQIATFADRAPWLVLEHASERLSDEYRVRLADEHPYEALQYASRHLSDEQITRLAERMPAAALRHAADRLSDVQRARLAEREPVVALGHVADRLSDGAFAACVTRAISAPEGQVVHVPDAEFDRLVQLTPAIALKHYAHKLSSDQVLAAFENTTPGRIDSSYERAAGRLSAEQLARLVEARPDTDRVVCKVSKPSTWDSRPEVLENCLKRDPSLAEEFPNLFSPAVKFRARASSIQ
jgi:hypothetical protein